MVSKNKDLERHLEAKAVEYAESLGWTSAKLDKGNKDWPDRGFFGSWGKSFFVEFKRPGQEARARQGLIHGRLRGFGHRVYVVDSLEYFKHVIAQETKL